MRRILSVLSLVLLPLLGGMQTASACVCAPARTPAQWSNDASRVFLGTVLEIGERRLVDHDLGRGYSQPVSFSVIQAWKGVESATIEIENRQTSCAAYYDVGTTYLVYTYYDATGDYHGSGGCWAIEMERAGQHLAFLDSATCPCNAMPTPEIALRSASAVFSGTVTALYDDPDTTDYVISVAFDAHTLWKNRYPFFEGTVNTPGVAVPTSAACGYPFAVGETYLIYAFESYEFGGNSSVPFVTSLCSRTKPLAQAAEDLAFLGAGTTSTVPQAPLPPHAKLSNYPNPFAETTTVSYALTEAAVVTLTVYDLTGRKIALRSLGVQAAGTHAETFDLTGKPAGMYFYEVQAGELVQRQVAVLAR